MNGFLKKNIIFNNVERFINVILLIDYIIFYYYVQYAVSHVYNIL